MNRTRTIAAVAIPVATLGVAAALVVPSAATASTSHKPAANGGSVTLTLTAPKAVTKTEAADVKCTTVNGVYRATTRITVRSKPVRIRVTVRHYDGVGSYDKSRLAIHRGRRTVIRSPKAPAVITATGGSYTFDKTLKRRDIHVAGTATWTCSTPSASS
jgi:hypothetical protein